MHATTLHIHNYKGITDISIDLQRLFGGIANGAYSLDPQTVIDLVHSCLHGLEPDDFHATLTDANLTNKHLISFDVIDTSDNEYRFVRSRNKKHKKDDVLTIYKNGVLLDDNASPIDHLLDLLNDSVDLLIHKHLHELILMTSSDEPAASDNVTVDDTPTPKKKKNKKTKNEKKNNKKLSPTQAPDQMHIDMPKLSEGRNIEAYEKNMKKGYNVTAESAHNKNVLVYIKKSVIDYERDLRKLQIELLKYQNHIVRTNQRVILLFEGRDAAGKNGTIRRFTAHLNPSHYKVIELDKPTHIETSQRYFQRYMPHLPSGGQIALFNRSRYNRAMVEPVMGFCTEQQHRRFLSDVVNVEDMLVRDGIILHKFYLSISKEEQAKRFAARKEDPLKQYKISPVDEKAQEFWNKYTLSKFEMLLATHRPLAPWTIVSTDSKKTARLNAIKHVLHKAEYDGKTTDLDFLTPSSHIIHDGATEINKMQETFKDGLSYFT